MIRSAPQAPASKTPVKEDHAVQLIVTNLSVSLFAPLRRGGARRCLRALAQSWNEGQRLAASRVLD